MRTRSRVLSPHRRAYTLLELCATLVIICVTAAILFPLVAGRGHRTIARYTGKVWQGSDTTQHQNETCASNLHLLGIAAALYAQDNDDTLPPAYAVVQKKLGGKTVRLRRFWLGAVSLERSAGDALSPHIDGGYLWPYLPIAEKYQCPELSIPKLGPIYLNNDLCGGKSSDEFTNLYSTVLMMDGENGLLPEIGHARELKSRNAVWYKGGGLREGKIISGAATRHQHNHSANYVFADGHMGVYEPKSIYFPQSNSGSVSHRDEKTNQALGPDPNTPMTYDGGHFQGTFHLR